LSQVCFALSLTFLFCPGGCFGMQYQIAISTRDLTPAGYPLSRAPPLITGTWGSEAKIEEEPGRGSHNRPEAGTIIQQSHAILRVA
jgi:hypothetical protein